MESLPKRRRIDEVEDKERTEALLHVQRKGSKLTDVAEKYRDDKEIVLAAVERNSWNAKYASPRLRNDIDVILNAVKRNATGLNAAPPAFKANAELVSLVVKVSGASLQFASPRLRSDRSIVVTAVKQCGYALKYASVYLRGDCDIVVCAVKQHGQALEFASAALRADRDVVACAVKQYGLALRFASADLRADREIALLAVNRISCFREKKYKDRLTMFRQEPEYILQRRTNPMEFVSEQLRSDKEVVLEAVKSDAFAFHYASEDLRADKEIVIAALKKNGVVLDGAEESLKDDPEVVGVAFASSCTRSVLSNIGASLNKRLFSVIRRLDEMNIDKNILKETEQDQDRGSAVIHYAEKVLKKPSYEKLWLLKQSLPPCSDDVGNLVFEFTGLVESDIKLANDMIPIALVISGIVDIGEDFKSIAKELREVERSRESNRADHMRYAAL